MATRSGRTRRYSMTESEIAVIQQYQQMRPRRTVPIPMTSIHPVYPLSLLDKFDIEAPLPGFASNFMMMTHNTTNYENKVISHDPQIVEFESQMITQIGMHLIKNGLHGSEMQVLSNCPSMRQVIGLALVEADPNELGRIPSRTGGDRDRNLKSLSKVENIVRVTIVILSVSDEDGSEARCIPSILRACHESREGVIILCHFTLIYKPKYYEKELWCLIEKLFTKDIISPHLTLKCSTHNKILDGVSTPQSFRHASPLGGCDESCRERSCGHLCFLMCHPRTRNHESHREFWCRFPCDLTCPQGHPCKKQCYERCACDSNCKFTHPCGHEPDLHRVCFVVCKETLACGHRCNLKCYQCFGKDHSTLPCNLTCEKKCHRGHPCNPRHKCITPCTPCKVDITEELPCGHRLIVSCQTPPFDVRSVQCKEMCARTYGGCNHKCFKRCYEECGMCEVMTFRQHPVCGHIIESRCNEIITHMCTELVNPRYPPKCGHTVYVPCKERHHDNSELLTKNCRAPCEKNGIVCGHPCPGNCAECFQDRFHARCLNPCGRRLICGHVCMVPCPAFCPPCGMACFIDCEHFSCPSECGVPCELVCKNPCPYECPHLKCELLCSEPCEREGCDKPCPKKLECGHDCVGFCGEICPPYCRICDSKNELEKGILTGVALDEDMRFIFLVNCRHVVESTDLDSWMNTVSGQEIVVKSCPICRTPVSLRGLRRYSKIIMAANEEVGRVKKLMYGKNKNIKDILESILLDIQEKLDAYGEASKISNFGLELVHQCTQPLVCTAVAPEGGSRNTVHFQSMYYEKALFIKGLHAIWESVWSRLEAKRPFWRPELLEIFEGALVEFFERLCGRQWPFHPNEVRETRNEVERFEDMFLLYDCYSSDRDPNILKLAETREGMQKFREANKVIRQWCSYADIKEDFQQIFRDFCVIQTYTLEISEKEKRQILDAFGGRSGRWFKCPQGHVYVVTECGGVTEVGQCNECGESIGGQNHAILPGNALASEMDGAQSPLYPTALARLQFNPNTVNRRPH